MTVFGKVMGDAGIAVDVHDKHLSFPNWCQTVRRAVTEKSVCFLLSWFSLCYSLGMYC